MRFRRPVAALLAITFVGACSSGTEPEPRTPGIHFKAGGGLTDSVDAVPVQALVVQVVPIKAGVVVRFESRPTSSGVVALVSSLAGAGFSGLSVDTTDASGTASARIQLGQRTGSASVAVIVPEFGYTDSTTYTIQPGAPAHVRLLPRDTVLTIAGTATIRGGVTDRYFNDRPDALTLVAQSPVLSASGRLVTGLQSGSGRVTAAFGALADTILVAVVPPGTISGVDAFGVLHSVNLDGTASTVLSPTAVHPVTSDWSADGQLLAIDGDQVPIRLVLPDGTLRAMTPAGLTAFYPEFSSDGQWLYYSIIGLAGFGWQIRRIHPDGTGDQQVLASAGADVAPALSPDGTRFAYTVTGTDELRISTLSGPSMPLAPNGHSPVWSPNGDLIAYNLTHGGQEIWVITPAGTGARRISRPGVPYALGLDWSPDGRWVLGRSGPGTFDLIDVVNSTTIPLHFTQGWSAPAWKR